MTKKTIQQPDITAQRMLDEIMDDTPSLISIPNTKKKYKIRWMKNGAKRKFTSIMSQEKDSSKMSSKSAAVIILNDYWKIKLLYPILWRWFYYFKQYTDAQLMPIISEGKKKVPVEAFLTNITLLTGMRDTIMTMTRDEVEHIQREQVTEKPLP